jgi:hypothetical protein
MENQTVSSFLIFFSGLVVGSLLALGILFYLGHKDHTNAIQDL